jgi:TonB-dependent receptor
VTNNGVTYSAVVTTPINARQDGHVSGAELSYQQAFTFLPGPLAGFGVNTNFTYIESTGVKQNTLSETDPEVSAGNVSTIDTSKLPLQGLSKENVNAEVFYEKYGISARVAYNWRSEFLLTPRDVIVPFQPIMQAAAGTLDASVFYEIHKGIKIGVQGVNLLNTVFETKAVIGQNPNGSFVEAGRSWFMEDRRLTAILRATF